MNNFLLIKSRLINKSKYLVILLIAIATLFLTGCSDLIARSNTSNILQIVDAILSDPKTFNPVLSSDATSTTVVSMLFDGLITQNPITGETEPALAESWTVSDDNLEIIFTLRKNLKWSDNQPLTADDVVFTFNELYLNDAIPSGAKDTLRVGESQQLPKVEKLNDLQIKFTLPEPFAPFLVLLGKASYQNIF
jgi:peptide/nickel transport system substrate-binding protein